MNNSNDLIKEKLKKQNPTVRIRMPTEIDFFLDKDDKTVKIVLQKESISSNMQEDAAAFEGWALIIKCVVKYEKVVFKWEKPTNTNDGHYQRFLFRMQNFITDFGEWASCDEINHSELYKIEKGHDYSINQPGKREKPSKDGRKGEAWLEVYFTENCHLLMDMTQAIFIDRQLPVGIFKGEVAKKNSIFTGGKSAIDLWGINKEKKELIIFELKGKNNRKVGVISEIYFYVCIMQNIIDKIFKYKEPHNQQISQILETRKIRAYFLTEQLHKLITKELVDELNKKVPKTTFGYLQIKETKENEISIELKEEW